MNNGSLIVFALAFLLTLCMTVMICRSVIPMLKRHAEQPIYEDGPVWHMSKSGTPTMGGISFITAISITLLLGAILIYSSGDKLSSLSLIICTAYSLMNASVGILDDITKLKHRKNAGLTPRAKLVFQFLISSAFLLARYRLLGEGSAVSFSFGTFDKEILYYPIALIILIGITNCANLTDGIDGLASSVSFAIGISLFYAYYGYSDTAGLIFISLAAGALGFLVYNINPARVFMGDTGSLFLGSLIAAAGFELGNPMIGVISGGIFVIEGISVIAQVAVYKACKKRLFKMAPLHHHLEKSGWNESKICLIAIILTLLFSIPTVLICGK